MTSTNLDIRSVIASPSGEFNVDRSTNVIIHCTDKHLSVPKTGAAKCPFIPKQNSDDDIPEFEFSATVLENLVRWTVRYGVEGVAASPLIRPCLYRDVNYVFTDAWDKEFYHSHLRHALLQRHYLSTMNAAEKYNMDGLLDFMAVGLGCRLRNEEDSTIIHDIMGVDKDVIITEEDMSKVSTDYPWFDDLTKPVFTQ